MDDDSYEVRQEATEKLRALAKASPGLAVELLGRQNLSIEVRSRWENIRRSASSSAGPRGLLGEMHPELRPPDATTRPQ